MKQFTLLMILLLVNIGAAAQMVTIQAVDRPAAEVFRSIVEQTGKNFVYSSALLKDVRISINASNKPLKSVLNEMFKNADIEYQIKGKNVILKQKVNKRAEKSDKPRATGVRPSVNAINALDEVVIVSRLEAPTVETSEIGARKITSDDIRNTPAMFGESDVIKSLQMMPGVSGGAEGMAAMHVHGGEADGNLFMLDNVPMYQVNHFAGLFSAFNTDIIRYIDFFSTSVPAKYDGRLSSFMDVRLKNGNQEEHHGSARISLTSGAFNLSGPISNRTSYVVGVRHTWCDLFTVPIFALVNTDNDEEKINGRYYFMDLNAKVNHRFSSRANGFVSIYFGNDYLKTGSKEKFNASDVYEVDYGWKDIEKYNFNWGNIVAQAGMNYRINPDLTSEFTAAYTRYFSSMRHYYKTDNYEGDNHNISVTDVKSNNHINDWIFRGDFDWHASDKSHVRFGAGYTRHSFLPAKNEREYLYNDTKILSHDSVRPYGANEVNIYAEDDYTISSTLRANAGMHASLFNIDGKTRYGLSPRLSLSYRPTENFAVKAAYTRTVQYVHQLAESYLALPTDQWIPITRHFKPESADKVALGAYWQSSNGSYSASVVGYYKYMRNLLDYRDEYCLRLPMEMWDARLTTGHGTAKGIDFTVEKIAGRFTGRISYSLAWADRTFKDKNGGLTFPARFDHRHTINLLASWRVSNRVSLSAAWIGHSGNRFTLFSQVWDAPSFGYDYSADDDVPLRGPINNYQLPFYHRLDLSCTVKNSRGYWTFGLYNAYNHMNTIAVKRDYKDVFDYDIDNGNLIITTVPVFKKVKFLPIIPSISYTWQF